MTAKNRYARRFKISEAKFRALVKLFALDLEATQIAELANLNRNTVNRFLKAIRGRLAEHSEKQFPFAGEIEVEDRSFSGGCFCNDGSE
jgi:transposase